MGTRECGDPGPVALGKGTPSLEGPSVEKLEEAAGNLGLRLPAARPPRLDK